MIISQGAEAVIELSDGKIFKKRIPKSYRHQDIDKKIRSSRTKREIKVMNKLKELNISVPNFFPNDDKFTICMQHIAGKRLRDILIENPSKLNYLKQLGEWLGIMHQNEIIHGDLTTSNVMVDKDDKMFLIDFGLSFFSNKFEDMAVDIHLLKQAIESTHYQNVDDFFKSFLEGYKHNNSKVVLERLKVVEGRGRNMNKN